MAGHTLGRQETGRRLPKPHHMLTDSSEINAASTRILPTEVGGADAVEGVDAALLPTKEGSLS
jgi:hypothetical protein